MVNFGEFKSLTSAAKELLGVNFYNGQIKKKLIAYCFELYGIDIVDIVERNKQVKKTCLCCGKPLNKNSK